MTGKVVSGLSGDLIPSKWSRNTVADGNWLQNNTLSPLSARDVYLAEKIDELNTDTTNALLNEKNERISADSLLSSRIIEISSNVNTLSSDVTALNEKLENSANVLNTLIIENSSSINNEILIRQSQFEVLSSIASSDYSALQTQIDTLKAATDVVDVFDSYSSFSNQSATELSSITDKDIVKILNDETISSYQVYYQYNKSNSGWTKIGSLPPYYSKTQINSYLDGKKSKQESACFSSTDKVISAIFQNENGEISAYYANISTGTTTDTMLSSLLRFTVDDKISSYNGSSFYVEGGSVPPDTMLSSSLGFTEDGQISSYNGSAFYVEGGGETIEYYPGNYINISDNNVISVSSELIGSAESGQSALNWITGQSATLSAGYGINLISADTNTLGIEINSDELYSFVDLGSAYYGYTSAGWKPIPGIGEVSGITTVEHDGTLSGTGLYDSPLGISTSAKIYMEHLSAGYADKLSDKGISSFSSFFLSELSGKYVTKDYLSSSLSSKLDISSFFALSDDFITEDELSSYITENELSSYISSYIDSSVGVTEDGQISSYNGSSFYVVGGSVPTDTMLSSLLGFTNVGQISSYNGSAFYVEGGSIPTDYVKDSELNVKIGSNNTASFTAFTQGSSNSAKTNSFSQGNNNTSQTHSFAQGDGNSASLNSFTQGIANYSDNHSFSQGRINSASYYSLAQGYNNTASAQSLSLGSANYSYMDSLSIGENNRAYNEGISVGENNLASAQSIAVGMNCSAEGASIAVGHSNSATNRSQAFGYNTVISNTGMAIGQYNKTSSDVAFVIGNGSSNNRSDLFYISNNGYVTIYGTNNNGTRILLSDKGLFVQQKNQGGTYDVKASLTRDNVSFSEASSYFGQLSTNGTLIVSESALIGGDLKVDGNISGCITSADKANSATKALKDSKNRDIYSTYVSNISTANVSATANTMAISNIIPTISSDENGYKIINYSGTSGSIPYYAKYTCVANPYGSTNLNDPYTTISTENSSYYSIIAHRKYTDTNKQYGLVDLDYAYYINGQDLLVEMNFSYEIMTTISTVGMAFAMGFCNKNAQGVGIKQLVGRNGNSLFISENEITHPELYHLQTNYAIKNTIQLMGRIPADFITPSVKSEYVITLGCKTNYGDFTIKPYNVSIKITPYVGYLGN